MRDERQNAMKQKLYSNAGTMDNEALIQMYTQDEIEDIVCTLEFAEKLNDFRAVNTCLDILCQPLRSSNQYSNSSSVSQINSSSFKLSSLIKVDTLERIRANNDVRQLQSNKKHAEELLLRMSMENMTDDMSSNLETE